MRGGALLASLGAHGVDPAGVTDVVLTHLHPDHFGWAVVNNATTFGRATFRCHALDWAHFVTDPPGPPARFASNLPALEERLQTFDHDGPVLPGIDARLTPGHTPGSTTIVLSSGTARALLLGDVVHCPVELLDSEWASLGDVDPDLAKRTKVALAAELESSRVPATASHFPGMRFGRLVPAEGRRRWTIDPPAA
jgi:glyoxylase-like metal-dependent hydrolase (beta-lactamase superfamily II)